nr:14986_t:CDS:2 [Entrophospora candida]
MDSLILANNPSVKAHICTIDIQNKDGIDEKAGLVIGFDPLEKISQKGMNSHRYGNTVVYAAIKFAIEETTKYIIYILFILKGRVVEAGFALVRTRAECNNLYCCKTKDVVMSILEALQMLKLILQLSIDQNNESNLMGSLGDR